MPDTHVFVTQVAPYRDGPAGVHGVLDQAAVDCVAAMNGAQKHRGPDGDGFFESGRGAFEVAFAHRRLAIIDLSTGANQPMRESASGCVITFNGEIYNYRVLRADLESRGERFTSGSDTSWNGSRR